jgi:site-specific DNA-methyltransferase (adenine-specific)
MKRETLFSSNKDDWSTPENFFKALDEEFHFDLDPCASHENHKCNKYYTAEDDGLRQDWGADVLRKSAV